MAKPSQSHRLRRNVHCILKTIKYRQIVLACISDSSYLWCLAGRSYRVSHSCKGLSTMVLFLCPRPWLCYGFWVWPFWLQIYLYERLICENIYPVKTHPTGPASHVYVISMWLWRCACVCRPVCIMYRTIAGIFIHLSLYADAICSWLTWLKQRSRFSVGWFAFSEKSYGEMDVMSRGFFHSRTATFWLFSMLFARLLHCRRRAHNNKQRATRNQRTHAQTCIRFVDVSWNLNRTLLSSFSFSFFLLLYIHKEHSYEMFWNKWDDGAKKEKKETRII